MRTDASLAAPRLLLSLALAVCAAVTGAPLGAQDAAEPAEPGIEAVVSPPAEEPAVIDEPQDDADGDRVSIFGGSRTVAEGESVGDVLVIGGNLNVRGEVRGDAVVVGGNLRLHETGRIRGDVVVAGGRFHPREGIVGGEIREMAQVRGVVGGPTMAREIRQERPGTGLFSRISRGFAGVISTLALGAVLAAAGAALIFYGYAYLETVSDTLRASTLRSGAVGVAAAFLVVPAFVVLIVALVVSIIGIPLLLLVVPLYPLAVATGAVFGLLGVAHAIGERTSEQRGLYESKHRNAYAYLGTGLVILFAPVLAGHLIGMTPFLGWVGGLIKFFAYAAVWVAVTVGLGAVILSRAGTRRTFAHPPLPPEEPILEEDPFLASSDV